MHCRLCLQPKTLQNSHIIPEFFYKPLYDDLHRAEVFSTSPDEKNWYLQKGIREELLCYDCEQFLSPMEDYARRVFYGGVEIPTPTGNNPIILNNIDYERFKLFQLSLLWRSSVSKDRFFSDVSLGPHEEKVRKMLITKNPGEPYDYGCILIGLLMEKNRPVDEMMTQPDSLRIDGHRCHRFLFGGCLWTFVVSKHSKNFKYKQFFLSKEGKLAIYLMDAKHADFITKFVRNLKGAGKLD
jgi:hypothetical protein